MSQRLTDEDLSAIRSRWDRECICPGTLFEDNPLKSMCGVCTIRRLLDDVAAIQAGLDTSELQRKDEGETHSANYDAIVEACGAPNWEYPGQVVRDVQRLRKERDEARAAIAPVVTRGVCATCGLSPILAADGSVGAHFDATCSGQAPCWGAGRPPRSTFASGEVS